MVVMMIGSVIDIDFDLIAFPLHVELLFSERCSQRALERGK